MEEKKEKKINLKFQIIAIICICLFAFAIVEKGLQNDTYYTVTLGKYVLENGIDMMEHFSWHEGLIYTYPHWLYDIVIYLIYSVMGFKGIYISTIVFSILLGIGIYLASTKVSKNKLISLGLTLTVLFFGSHFVTARAQLITFILFVFEIYCIEAFLESAKKRYAFYLILIPIIISNVHAAVFPMYFIFYLPYIAEYIIVKLYELDLANKLLIKIDKSTIKRLSKKETNAEKISKIQKRIDINQSKIEDKKEHIEERLNGFFKIKLERNKNVKWLILIMIICIFTGLLTPIGDTPYTYLYKTMKGNTTKSINEHLPIILYSNKTALIGLALIVGVISLTKVKIRLRDLFLISGVAFLTIMARRQLSLLLFIGVISFSRVLSDMFEIYDKDGCKDMMKLCTTVLGQIFIFVFIGLLSFIIAKKNIDMPIVKEDSYPVKACDWIEENLDLTGKRLYNDYNYGSYLMYRGIQVFIDSRADVYDPEFNGLEDDIFTVYMQLNSLSRDYEQEFKKYDIDYVMTYKGAKLNYCLSRDDNYKQLYLDDNFVIYERLKK